MPSPRRIMPAPHPMVPGDGRDSPEATLLLGNVASSTRTRTHRRTEEHPQRMAVALTGTARGSLRHLHVHTSVPEEPVGHRRRGFGVLLHLGPIRVLSRLLKEKQMRPGPTASQCGSERLLSARQTLTMSDCFNPDGSLWGRCYYCLHFREGDGGAEARGPARAAP